VTARAGLSDACAISYIQYIGVITVELTSAGISGVCPNSPIGILLNPLLHRSIVAAARDSVNPPLTYM
jgi:hypothetical protein